MFVFFVYNNQLFRKYLYSGIKFMFVYCQDPRNNGGVVIPTTCLGTWHEIEDVSPK